ncbi:MAG: alpha-amylase family glycosyl hydrolase [Nostoc sp.]|uniref:alpha-amylase family glycosyl hydrolase n=1 Tax=Nostoc sp. TaxID=1180 RepID=UPI002FF4DE65
MPTDLLSRKKTHFVLWRPGASEPSPALYIGSTPPDNPEPLTKFREIPLRQSTQFPELWEVSAQEVGLNEGQVYFYWFKVHNSDGYSENANPIIYATDPTATTVDRRFANKRLESGVTISPNHPASVVLYRNGELIPSDPEGKTVNWEGDVPLKELPTNNQLVIYELPTRWAKNGPSGVEKGNGTFRDALALLVKEVKSLTFTTVDALNNHAHLVELGVNALELLPPEDSKHVDEWGYGTANYFAADFDLGRPDYQLAPTATTDLVDLIKAAHQHGLRFFIDVVMAFSLENPYHNVNFLDFYIQWNSGDPEQRSRDGFGGDLFKYNYRVEGYHPITGQKSSFVPAREYLKAHIAHWLEFYRVDGLRLDSVNNIANYDFLQEFKDFARNLWNQRGGSSDRFLVVGEELSVPLALIQQNRLDGLWNEKFKQIFRQVILGKNAWDEPSFERSVRKLIDCRNLGFRDGSQAVNYLTSHDIGGYGNERLFNYLVNNGVKLTEERIKLGFVSLLTAVGIPMILAGDEFADQQDLDISDDRSNHKQIDPVNFDRVSEDWRQRIFQYVARLVHFRKTSNALAVNDTQFIHVDFNEGKRVLVWQRGNKADELVVVVANFSDYGTPPGSEYRVPSWPATPVGKQWQEITQERIVPPDWVGREGIVPWEAKVYALV